MPAFRKRWPWQLGHPPGPKLLWLRVRENCEGTGAKLAATLSSGTEGFTPIGARHSEWKPEVEGV
jgi:hypothetical protein